MNETQNLMVIGAAWAVIVGLIGVVWNMVRTEAKNNAAALDMKASHESLKETKTDFLSYLERHRTEIHQRLQEVSQRQDREIDWLKEEMDKISSNLAEMRRENTQANTTILQRLQDLAMAVGQKK